VGRTRSSATGPQIRLGRIPDRHRGSPFDVRARPEVEHGQRTGRTNAGLMGSVMNTAGQVGGILSRIVLSRLVGSFNASSLPLIVPSRLYLTSSLCWIFIKPERERG